jgi:hypothetical protein
MSNAPDWLRYANQSATRRLPLSDEMLNAMSFLPELGLQMEVFSGGQPAIGTSNARVGSTRHDHGKAADVFFLKDGQRLDWSNPEHVPVFQEVVRRGKQAGLTGFGAGPGYMQPGSMHIGYGAPAVWGAGGSRANAPDWLVQAFNEGKALAPDRPAPGSTMASAPAAPQGQQVPFLAPPQREPDTELAEIMRALAPQVAAPAQQTGQGASVQKSDPMAPIMAAMQGAEMARQNTATAMPDIEALLGLRKRPVKMG